MKEAMTKMKQQTAELALTAQRDAEAAAAERKAAESKLAETQQALQAEQNKVKSVEVSSINVILGRGQGPLGPGQ